MSILKRLTMGTAFRVLLSLLCIAAHGVADEGRKSPASVKAALIAKFPHYIDWKDKSGDTITVGFLGDDPVAKEFNALVSGGTPLTAKGRTIQMKRGSSAADLKGCQLIFIATSAKGDVKSVISAFQAAGAVTVSDIDQFTSKGGMIGFVTVEERIKVEIDGAAAKKAGVSINPQLLKIGKRGD
jgi:hypothetical protein